MEGGFFLPESSRTTKSELEPHPEVSRVSPQIPRHSSVFPLCLNDRGRDRFGPSESSQITSSIFAAFSAGSPQSGWERSSQSWEGDGLDPNDPDPRARFSCCATFAALQMSPLRDAKRSRSRSSPDASPLSFRPAGGACPTKWPRFVEVADEEPKPQTKGEMLILRRFLALCCSCGETERTGAASAGALRLHLNAVISPPLGFGTERL